MYFTLKAAYTIPIVNNKDVAAKKAVLTTQNVIIKNGVLERKTNNIFILKYYLYAFLYSKI